MSFTTNTGNITKAKWEEANEFVEAMEAVMRNCPDREAVADLLDNPIYIAYQRKTEMKIIDYQKGRDDAGNIARGTHTLCEFCNACVKKGKNLKEHHGTQKCMKHRSVKTITKNMEKEKNNGEEAVIIVMKRNGITFKLPPPEVLQERKEECLRIREVKKAEKLAVIAEQKEKRKIADKARKEKQTKADKCYKKTLMSKVFNAIKSEKKEVEVKPVKKTIRPTKAQRELGLRLKREQEAKKNKE